MTYTGKSLILMYSKPNTDYIYACVYYMLNITAKSANASKSLTIMTNSNKILTNTNFVRQVNNIQVHYI